MYFKHSGWRGVCDAATLASATINSASLNDIEFMTNGINDGIEISLVNTGLLQDNSITFTVGDMGTSTYNAQLMEYNLDDTVMLTSAVIDRPRDYTLSFKPNGSGVMKLVITSLTNASDVIGISNLFTTVITYTSQNITSNICNSGGDKYRFGFNGQEKVNEIAGTGNHNTALFWEYDTRLGRRWNLDPVDQISISNYACFGNSPIVMSDVLGDQKKNKGLTANSGNNLTADGMNQGPSEKKEKGGDSYTRQDKKEARNAGALISPEMQEGMDAKNTLMNELYPKVVKDVHNPSPYIRNSVAWNYLNDNIFIDIQNKQLIINSNSPKGISWEDIRQMGKDKVIDMGKDYIKEKSYDLIQKYGKNKAILFTAKALFVKEAIEKGMELKMGKVATKSIGMFVGLMTESLECGPTIEAMNNQCSKSLNKCFSTSEGSTK